MQSSNPTVQLKASNALATFVYNNRRLDEFLADHYRFSFDYFERFLRSSNDHIRCAAAFQVRRAHALSAPSIVSLLQTVALSNLIPEQSPAVNTAIGCGVLMDVLRTSATDEGKSDAAECLTRLAHMKSSEAASVVLVFAHVRHARFRCSARVDRGRWHRLSVRLVLLRE